LLSIFFLEDKGDRVAFVNGKNIVWGKGSSIEDAKTFGIREGRLYGILTPLPQALIHLEINRYEL